MSTKTTKQTSSLLTLPIEIIFNIFDKLDAKTILLSLRGVCTQLYTLASIYDQYHLEINSISNRNIHLIGRLIQPKHVISLSLSGSSEQPDKLELFLSLIQIERFTRLHSLSLSSVKDGKLDRILRNVNSNTLTSLSLSSTSLFTKSTMTLLSSTIAKNSLRQLYFDINTAIIDQILWPVQCTIEKLTIHGCTDVQILVILRQSPFLRRLSLKNFELNRIDQASMANPFRQITSLILDCRNTLMKMLELFLYLTPSITHLGLNCLNFSANCLRRFSECEQFIQKQLPLLNTFTYCIQCPNYDDDDIESLILPFRTEFWLKQKRWFVTCKYIIDSSNRSVTLQSSPISELDFLEGHEGKAISCVTSTKSTYSVRMNLAEIVNYVEWNTQAEQILRNTTQLTLEIDKTWSQKSFECLSMQIDLVRLTQIWLVMDFRCPLDSNMVNTLLERAHNVHSLGISIKCHAVSIGRAQSICAIIPRQIKHLKVVTKNVETIKSILQQVEHLSSVTFFHQHDSQNVWLQIVEWLKGNERYYRSQEDDHFLQIWFN